MMIIHNDEKRLEYFNGDELATSTWVGKYQLDESEVTPDDMHHRMASEFYRIDKKFQKKENLWWNKRKLSYYGKHREKLTEKSIYELFKDFKYIIPQGSVMSQLGNHYVIGSLSNCVVIGQPKDSYGGIMKKDEELTQLMKRRCGVGLDISTLRPTDTMVANAAKTSTGAVSFMNRFSETTREVAQSGRRGALMLSINVNHPEVEDFISAKEDKTKITGANVSVLLTDKFMKAVKNDEDYFLKFPVDFDIDYEDNGITRNMGYGVLKEFKIGGDTVYIKKIRAKDVYNHLVRNAWANGEPGQMFVDAHWDNSPDGVYPKYKGVTTNPCGEIFMPEGDACRLIAINLFSFVVNPFTKKAFFDYDKFYEVMYEQQRLSDDLVELEIEKVDKILDKILSDKEDMKTKQVEYDLWSKLRDMGKEGRRTGSGFTALGDTLAALGVAYDSKKAQKIVDIVMRTKMTAEFDCSIDLAILRGSFKEWDHRLEFNQTNGLDDRVTSGKNTFYQHMVEEFPDLANRMVKYGRRNVSISTVAPTGSLSMLAQVTSGIEPIFMAYYKRRKKINPNDKNVVADFIDANGDQWSEFNVLHHKFKEWCEKQVKGINVDKLTEEELKEFFEKSPWYKSTANDINWIKRVEMQAIIQKYTTHSISSTINLPNDATEEDVFDIYMTAWEKGLKGITVYRDGCRDGVLISTNDGNKEGEIVYNSAPKRPSKLECDIYHPTVNGKKYTVLVGMLKGKPYEVFSMDYEIAKNRDNGIIHKIKSGHYNLLVNVRDTEEIIERINDNMSETEATLSMSLSGNLRHGMKVEFIVDMLNKSKGLMMGFSKSIARTLKKYIAEGAGSTAKCQDCGGRVRYEEGCQKCYDCGSSKCG